MPFPNGIRQTTLRYGLNTHESWSPWLAFDAMHRSDRRSTEAVQNPSLRARDNK